MLFIHMLICIHLRPFFPSPSPASFRSIQLCRTFITSSLHGIFFVQTTAECAHTQRCVLDKEGRRRKGKIKKTEPTDAVLYGAFLLSSSPFLSFFPSAILFALLELSARVRRFSPLLLSVYVSSNH